VKKIAQPTDETIGRPIPGANPEQPMGSLSYITLEGGETGTVEGNIGSYGRTENFGVKKNRHPTEKTCDRSVTGESTPMKDQKGGEKRCYRNCRNSK
jgi:hypothetical protein